MSLLVYDDASSACFINNPNGFVLKYLHNAGERVYTEVVRLSEMDLIGKKILKKN